MTKRLIMLMFLTILPGLLVPDAWSQGFDHSAYERVLKTFVDDQGRVDYRAISRDAGFSAYLESLQTVNIDEFSKNGQLALWLNAYNAVTIDKVIKWKPKKSVRETPIPGIWTSTRFFTTREHLVAGRRLSQDDIEHEILRKVFKDPRIHFAIVCASSSCPPLARFAYTADNVQTRLEEETRKYINSTRGTRIDYAKNTLYLSKIFDWFAGDFISISGSVLEFIKPYLAKDAIAFLRREPKIAYIHYDWALNAKAPLN